MPGFRVLALSWPPDPMSHAPSTVSYLLGTGIGSEEGVGGARKHSFIQQLCPGPRARHSKYLLMKERNEEAPMSGTPGDAGNTVVS